MTKISYKNYYRDPVYMKYEPMFRNIFMKRFLLINRLIDNRSCRVLDIGCSIGVFLDLFREAPPSYSFGEAKWETWGVEPSKSANTARKKGHKVIKDYFEKAKLPENYFDLVIMNHTLEHMDDPTVVLMKVRNLLKNEGIVLVDVPNAGGLGAKLLGKHWPYLLPKEHKHQFTKDSLSEIFGKAGFRIIHFESRSGLFEYENPFLELWQAFIGLKMRFFTDILTFPYSLVASAINMGDSMSIIGKKI